jgi:hypothetical protein
MNINRENKRDCCQQYWGDSMAHNVIIASTACDLAAKAGHRSTPCWLAPLAIKVQSSQLLARTVPMCPGERWSKTSVSVNSWRWGEITKVEKSNRGLSG